MGLIKLLERTAASVSTPSAGKSALFFDSADGLLKFRDDAGNLTVVLGNTADLTAFMRTLLDDTTALAARTTLEAAALASPTFTGTPAAPTAAVGTSTTQLATTQFVDRHCDPMYRFHAWSDWTLPSNGAGVGFLGANSGTGTSNTNIANAAAGRIGVVRAASGTTTTGRANYSATPSFVAFFLGQGVARWRSIAATPTLPTAAENFTTRHGFIGSLTGTEGTDAVQFRMTDGVNGGRFQAVCVSNSVETAADTGIAPVAGQFYKFEIVVNAGATSVDFKIDGATVATVTTNIPSGVGREVSYGSVVAKTAGTTSVNMMDLDFTECVCEFTTPRW